MAVQVKYANDVQVSYSLTTYSPYEGLTIAFNGMNGPDGHLAGPALA